jgi:hypothetical protein
MSTLKKKLSTTQANRIRFNRAATRRANDETLRYPTEIAAEIGLNVNEVNGLKKKGCPFYGKKTSVRIVRAFLYRTMGAESLLALPERLPRSAGNRSGEPAATNDSQAA